MKTDRDGLVFDEDRAVLEARMRTAFSGEWPPGFADAYKVRDSSSYNLTGRLKRLAFEPSALRQCLYRPFDVRWLYYHPGFTSRSAWQVMQHMARENIALIAKRQARDGPYDWVFAASGLIVDGLFSIDNKGREQLFPLWLYAAPLLESSSDRSPNLSRAAFQLASSKRERIGGQLAESEAEAVLGYVYAVLSAPSYRARFDAFLRQGFPRVPVCGNNGLMDRLAVLGARLLAVHTLQNGAVGGRYTGSPRPLVAAPTFAKRADGGVVWINGADGFEAVPEAAWDYVVGGHLVLQKWLKDRKGRTLAPEDIEHYKRIIGAITETIRIQKEIDEVIEAHGGWPAAFAAPAAAAGGGGE